MRKPSAQFSMLLSLTLFCGCRSDAGFQAEAAQTGRAGKFSKTPQQPAISPGEIGRSGSIPAERVQQTLKDFSDAYLKLGNPRLLIYANRELANTKATGAGEVPVQWIVEQAFAKPFRATPAAVADQKTANETAAGKLFKAPDKAGETKAAQDRDALRNVADVVIEILMLLPEAAGDTAAASAPSLQATAIRLEDGRIIGQASTANLKNAPRPVDLRDASETVALLLMEDLIREAK